MAGDAFASSERRGLGSAPRDAEDASPAPLVVSMAMGYGHLRAAHALADALGTEVLHADRPPLAEPQEERLWAAARRLYEWASRTSQLRWIGGPLRRLLDAVTHIPRFEPDGDHSAATRSVRALGRLVDRGLGHELARRLTERGAPLLTTHFAPAVAADEHRRGLAAAGAGPNEGVANALPAIHCVVTDADLARAWVGRRPAETGVTYLVPSRRAMQRLRAYGVPTDQVEKTGFPLPDELLGGPDLAVLRRNLAARMVRLDPRGTFRRLLGPEVESFLGPLPEAAQAGRAPHLAFVVGGAGAQADLAEPLLTALAEPLAAGRLSLTLVAGTRREVADEFHRAARRHGLEPEGVEESGGDGSLHVLWEPTVDAYFRRFNRLLAATDLLWTKPSELTFFAALGLPLVFTRPVGVQERHNRRWAEHHRAALRAPDPRHAAERLDAWLADGSLATTAWNGFLHLPKLGLYRILQRVERGDAAARYR